MEDTSVASVLVGVAGRDDWDYSVNKEETMGHRFWHLTISCVLGLAVPVLLPAGLARAQSKLTENQSLKDAISKFTTALVAGDKRARQAVCTFEEISSVTKKVTDPKEYQAEVDEFFKEYQVAPGTTLKEATIEEVMFLPAAGSDKLKKDLVFAIVNLTVLDPEGNPHGALPLFFILTEKGWRISVKK